MKYCINKAMKCVRPNIRSHNTERYTLSWRIHRWMKRGGGADKHMHTSQNQGFCPLRLWLLTSVVMPFKEHGGTISDTTHTCTLWELETWALKGMQPPLTAGCIKACVVTHTDSLTHSHRGFGNVLSLHDTYLCLQVVWGPSVQNLNIKRH